jgi:hypothetical protein
MNGSIPGFKYDPKKHVATFSLFNQSQRGRSAGSSPSAPRIATKESGSGRSSATNCAQQRRRLRRQRRLPPTPKLRR